MSTLEAKEYGKGVTFSLYPYRNITITEYIHTREVLRCSCLDNSLNFNVLKDVSVLSLYTGLTDVVI